MATGPWTDEENDAIVADYFAMLDAELAGRPYSKAAHNRDLRGRMGRERTSIEFKHQNISAVLQGLGEDWIRGYKPAFNFQGSLVDAVARWSARNHAWFERKPAWLGATGPAPATMPVGEAPSLWIGEGPTRSPATPRKTAREVKGLLERFDPAGRDARNRVLGRAGEELVFARERSVLARAGRDDLARKVRWVSQEDGDGAGYDIASFDPDGRQRLLEVKTTNGWDRTPFFITRNELRVAGDRREEWRLLRVWDFSRGPKAFELRPPLEAHVSLVPTAFRADWG
jgi:hypothetical protein